LESYTLCLCQLAISFLFIGNINSYFEYAEEFFSKNKTLKHSEMELELQMLSGYVYNFCGNLENAKESYMNSLKVNFIF
jgi:Flp pilus assembly protein TadD